MVPPTEMVGWWPGDGAANDIRGTNHGTLVNTAAFGPGMVGDAFLLDGSSGYVNAGNDSSLHLSPGEFTVDAWVRFDGFVLYDRSIIDKMLGTPYHLPGARNEDGWRLIKQDDNHFWFCLGGGPGENGCGNGHPNTVRSTTIAQPDTWYHLAAVVSATEFGIYVNGVLEDSKPRPAFTDTGAADLLIGSNFIEGHFLNGSVDEVELFSRALSAGEVQGIHDAQSFGKCRWTPKASLPGPRAQHGVGVVGGELYAVGGGSALHCLTCFATGAAKYAPGIDTWTPMADATPRKNHGTATVGDTVYVVGGDDNFAVLASVEAFQPSTNTWSTRAPLPSPRTGLAAAAVGGFIYVVGGGSAAVDVYNPAADSWSSGPPIPTPRISTAAIGFEDELYVVGGFSSTLGYVATVEVFSPATASWSVRAPLPDPRSGLALAVAGGKLYAIGGFEPGIGSVSRVDVYDPANDSWTPGTPLTNPRKDLAAGVIGGVIFAIGGLTAGPTGAGISIVADVEAFDTGAADPIYTFVGPLAPYVAPPDAVKAGRVIPLRWQYATSTVQPVDSADAAPVVRVWGPVACGETAGGATIELSTPGGSGYHYDPVTRTWQFNWQTKSVPAGCYYWQAGSQVMGPSGLIPIRLR